MNTTYKYKTQWVDLSSDNGISQLNELGAQGWELVQVLDKLQHQHQCVFRKTEINYNNAVATTWTQPTFGVYPGVGSSGTVVLKG